MTGRTAVFLDRDGTINENVFNPASGRWEAPLAAEELRLLPGVPAALRALADAGYALILVSNQPNCAIGKATAQTMAAIHERLVAELEREGVPLTDAYYCYHHPNGSVPGLAGPCVCRKPSPYYLRRAEMRYGLDMKRCWMVGDRASDVGCGKAAGARTIFLTSIGHVPPRADEPQPDAVAGSLAEAVHIILGEETDRPGNAAQATSAA